MRILVACFPHILGVVAGHVAVRISKVCAENEVVELISTNQRPAADDVRKYSAYVVGHRVREIFVEDFITRFGLH